MDPICDIVLQHQSISRKHAVLQFDKQGRLFIQDFQSTYGTRVNKRRINCNTFERLRVGDIVVFGESTRLYCITGPVTDMPKEKTSSYGHVSWGLLAEEAQEVEEEEEEEKEEKPVRKETLPAYLLNFKPQTSSAYESTVLESQIEPSNRKLYESLGKRISKLNNLQIEIQRILAKEMDQQGLTDGQQLAVERNETRMDVLRKEISELENQLHLIISRREQKKRRQEEVKERKISQKKAKVQEVETVESLEKKVADLKARMTEQEVKVSSFKSTKPATAIDPTDSLAQYMAQTAEKLVEDNISAARDEYLRLEKEMKQLEKILDIARPAIDRVN